MRRLKTWGVSGRFSVIQEKRTRAGQRTCRLSNFFLVRSRRVQTWFAADRNIKHLRRGGGGQRTYDKRWTFLKETRRLTDNGNSGCWVLFLLLRSWEDIQWGHRCFAFFWEPKSGKRDMGTWLPGFSERSEKEDNHHLSAAFWKESRACRLDTCEFRIKHLGTADWKEGEHACAHRDII